MIVDMPGPPPPIVLAHSIKPSAPVAAVAKTVVETSCCHIVHVTQRLDEGVTAWMARVTGEKATKSCPSKGFKIVYAPDEVMLKKRIVLWLEEA